MADEARTPEQDFELYKKSQELAMAWERHSMDMQAKALELARQDLEIVNREISVEARRLALREYRIALRHYGKTRAKLERDHETFQRRLTDFERLRSVGQIDDQQTLFRAYRSALYFDILHGFPTSLRLPETPAAELEVVKTGERSEAAEGMPEIACIAGVKWLLDRRCRPKIGTACDFALRAMVESLGELARNKREEIEAAERARLAGDLETWDPRDFLKSGI